MSESPRDPFAGFGTGFVSSVERVKGERAQRLELGAKAIPYHHGFLDDVLRALLPHDLVLLGAWSGVGKTALAAQISSATCGSGRRVGYFALEAEDGEIERRRKYAILAPLVAKSGLPGADDLNYADWYLGRCEDVAAPFDVEVERQFAADHAGMQTYYRGRDFNAETLTQLFYAIQDQVDLIILDHLHYVDVDDSKDENRAYKDLIKAIRHTSLSIGKPVLVVVHLRKRADRKQLVPTLDDIHGSSDIGKVCTRVIMLAPAVGTAPGQWYQAPTFITVPKDRVSGTTGHVALCQFDRRLQRYEKGYVLGRLGGNGDRWEPIYAPDLPRWAKHADRIFPAAPAKKEDDHAR